MQRNMDPLEFLTTEHDRLDKLIARVATTRDLETRKQAFEKLADALTEHLAVKQEFVYPHVRSVITEDVVSELIAEHVEIKRVLADLVWLEVDDALFDLRLDTLMTLVEGHMQWQEDEFFVALATTMTPDDLAALGTRLWSWYDRAGATPGVSDTARVSEPDAVSAAA